jgi:ribonuclease-3
VTQPVVIFRTQSDVEASIVRGLLDAHGIQAIVSSDVPHSVFPLTVNALGEVRIAVHPADADEARHVIASHRHDAPVGQVVPIRDGVGTLERAIDYRFRDRGLLEHAMTHTSRANEDPSGAIADNESLEFLGDAVLGFIVADLLYHEFPDFDEGRKSKVKASFVSTATLARQAERLQLGAQLLLGRGEEKTGGRLKQALLADAYEALIAAIYLDGGMAQARAFVAREFAPLLSHVRESGVIGQDHKSALQEYLQSHDRPLPEYRLAGTAGPDHRKRFLVEAVVEGEAVATGSGSSKREAEQEAARLALASLFARADGT